MRHKKDKLTLPMKWGGGGYHHWYTQRRRTKSASWICPKWCRPRFERCSKRWWRHGISTSTGNASPQCMLKIGKFHQFSSFPQSFTLNAFSNEVPSSNTSSVAPITATSRKQQVAPSGSSQGPAKRRRGRPKKAAHKDGLWYSEDN